MRQRSKQSADSRPSSPAAVFHAPPLRDVPSCSTALRGEKQMAVSQEAGRLETLWVLGRSGLFGESVVVVHPVSTSSSSGVHFPFFALPAW